MGLSKHKFQKLFIPILIEQLFFLLMNQMDTLMLSVYSSKATAAVGLSNQFLILVTFFITIIHVGVSIRLIHHKEQSKHLIRHEIYHSMSFNLIASLILAGIVLLCLTPILHVLQVPSDIFTDTYHYSETILYLLFMNTTNMLLGTILRTLDRPKQSTIVSIVINVINIVLNAMVLFVVPKGFIDPIYGIAWATNISRVIGLVCLTYFILKIAVPQLKDFLIKKRIAYPIVQLGMPGAGEQISYNVSQVFLTAFIAMLGSEMVAAKSISGVLAGISFSVAMAYGVASQIYIGRFIARYKYQLLHTFVKRHLVITFMRSIIIMLCVIAIVFIVGPHLFHPKSVFDWVMILLISFILLEPVRALNTLIVDILNVSGDVRYPVVVSIITTWVLTIPLSYLFGIQFHLGILGIIGINILDEALRFLVMLHRFRTGKWQLYHSRIGVQKDV